MKSETLNNPALLTLASTPEGQKAIQKTGGFISKLLIVGGVILVGSYGWSKYKKLRAEKYANKNIGNPNLIAAAIIYKSFKRFEIPGFIGSFLPSFDIWTDEAALNSIAVKVTNIKAVSDAYNILFDRNLFTDTTNGLDTAELNTFWNIIKSPSTNEESTLYAIGSKLYVAQKPYININQAVKQGNGQWKGTGLLYGKYNYGDLVGVVIAHGKVPQGMEHEGQNYYIVQEIQSPLYPFSGQCLYNCLTGVVVQGQVSNIKN